ncbi:hypothetical protein LTR37_012479 [Vermiconidia calcicola]|uniref:Uncharacterized protein n=1 Tax=Vermiconidia calcicola TaxID=1690605 RepID=A0ACC3MZB7_9PEZI|nr:hypothetical protein LTR37_012479 [Vermiconidia calcicola]
MSKRPGPPTQRPPANARRPQTNSQRQSANPPARRPTLQPAHPTLQPATQPNPGPVGYPAPSNQARPPLRSIQPGVIQPSVAQGPAPTAPNPRQIGNPAVGTDSRPSLQSIQSGNPVPLRRAPPAPAQTPGLSSQPNTQPPRPNPQVQQPNQQLRPPNTQPPRPNPQVQQPNQQLGPPNTQPPPPNPQVQQPNQRRGRRNLYTRENGREARGTWCLPDDPYGGITAGRDVVRRDPTYVPHESVDDRSGQYGYNPASPYPQYQQGRGDRLPENDWAGLRPSTQSRNETTPLNGVMRRRTGMLPVAEIRGVGGVMGQDLGGIGIVILRHVQGDNDMQIESTHHGGRAGVGMARGR